MKSIFLTVVIICAITVSALGGTFAYLSDTEESYGNKIEVGSLDLKVNDKDDVGAWWGTGIGQIVNATCILPDDLQRARVKVTNDGCLDGYLYIVFKNEFCYNTEKDGALWYLDKTAWPYNADHEKIPPAYKPEPELVTEYGGMLAQQEIEGQRVIGDNCCMRSNVGVKVTFRGTSFIDKKTMGDVEDTVYYAGKLPKCGVDKTMLFEFIVPQLHEGTGWYYKYDYFSAGSPFEGWPTNALMADGIEFDVMFILVDHVLTGDEIDAIENDLD
jgi:predicted ribosomally synthesized peptide with SipW-like signal peptide